MPVLLKSQGSPQVSPAQSRSFSLSYSHFANWTMESREVTQGSLSTDMPQWAVVTVAIGICCTHRILIFTSTTILSSYFAVAFALAIMVLVGVVGQVCGRKESTLPLHPWRPRSRWHLLSRPERTVGNVGRSLPDTVSVDTITLAIMRPPPPVYIHPPRYHASFKAANNMERGADEAPIGMAL
jgi:hypothetical protein